MVTLKPHQAAFVKRNPDKAILAHGTRTGKTYTIAFWAKNRAKTKFVLACPKRIKDQWVRDLKLCGTKNVTVVSKEELKKTDLSKFNGFIFDEAHHLASGLYEKPSQLTAYVYGWLREHPDYPVLLATATPIASKPANLHTLATLTGIPWNWKKYQAHLYNFVRRPYAPFPFWEAKPEWRTLIQPLAKEVLDIVLLSDIMDVPEQKHTVVTVLLKPETIKEIKEFASLNPSEEWYGKHQLAQRKEKLDKVRDLSEGESKVIVVCRYTDQLNYYATELAKDREVFVLDGHTKDPGAIIKAAHESTECYFLMQSECAEGFRGDSFSVMIFASLSHRTVSLQQAYGRMLHLDKQSGNQYWYLIADEKDREIYERVVIAGKEYSIAAIAKEKAEA